MDASYQQARTVNRPIAKFRCERLHISRKNEASARSAEGARSDRCPNQCVSALPVDAVPMQFADDARFGPIVPAFCPFGLRRLNGDRVGCVKLRRFRRVNGGRPIDIFGGLGGGRRFGRFGLFDDGRLVTRRQGQASGYRRPGRRRIPEPTLRPERTCAYEVACCWLVLADVASRLGRPRQRLCEQDHASPDARTCIHFAIAYTLYCKALGSR